MVDSLFLTPAFLFAESSFVVVASVAAYELLVGDFIWAQQQEEARRESVRSRRGRVPGYDTFEGSGGRHGPQHPGGVGGQQHRSLSPAGRGRGGHARSGGQSRRGSPGDDSLVYPSRARGGNVPRDARISEEAFYSSSSAGDARYASPGRGSPGDSTRRLFYKAILLALVSRFIFLPIETYFFFRINNSSSDQNILPNTTFSPTIFHIILRISQTFPDLAFASALGLLVIFCAQVAFAAMPPLTPESGEGIVRGDDDPEMMNEVVAENEALLGDGTLEVRGSAEGVAHQLRRRTNFVRTCCARLSRTLLASKTTYAAWNSIIFVSYALVFVAVLVLPNTPISVHELLLWILILAVYSFLLLSLIYVASLLGRALSPGIARRKNSDSLALRLVGTCTLLAIMFTDRVVCFGMVTHRALLRLDDGVQDGRIRIGYARSTIEYAFAESLPVLLILFMMHRKRKEIQNDVLILWSLFGSTGRLAQSHSQLDTTAAASGEVTGSAAVKGGGLGARRFQSYGGVRGDSFPPSSGNKPRRSMPRAVSSSGGGGLRPQHHQESAADVLAAESGSILSNVKKGLSKPYMPLRSATSGSDDR